MATCVVRARPSFSATTAWVRPRNSRAFAIRCPTASLDSMMPSLTYIGQRYVGGGNFVKPAGLACFLHCRLAQEEAGMKAGYTEAAWRLFQPSLAQRPGRSGVLTWADMELAGTPFGRAVSLP